ncbi:MSHA biogenesis protein MshI [hydrothermal vent metagenome]|uniref:MSHA biogenesis protein MshI n=1 Tax=hydrothermal vent metagenome TaxID=652676 RepID=A0A3B1A7E7_9ZZZZ
MTLFGYEGRALFNLFNKNQVNKLLIGAEFSENSIAIAQVSYTPEQQPRLLLCERGQYSSSNSADDILSTFKEITKKIKLKDFVLNTTIQQHERQLLLIEAPQVEASELKEAARWKIKDMIDFNIDDAVIDVIEIPNMKELKRTPMIYAVVVKREKVNDIVTLNEKCGSKLSVIDIPDMAQRNFAALLPEDHNGIAILSINSKSSLLTITRQGKLYLSRELETGFEALMSNEIKHEPNSETDTPILKLMVESSSAAISESLERMVLEIQRSLDYYESQYNQPQIKGLYLAPFNYDVSEIKNYFSEQLGIKTKMLDFNILFSTDEPIPYQLQADTFYAVGAALR